MHYTLGNYFFPETGFLEAGFLDAGLLDAGFFAPGRIETGFFASAAPEADLVPVEEEETELEIFAPALRIPLVTDGVTAAEAARAKGTNSWLRDRIDPPRVFLDGVIFFSIDIIFHGLGRNKTGFIFGFCNPWIGF